MANLRLAAVVSALTFALCVTAQTTKYVTLNITVGEPLPVIPLFEGNTINLDMLPAHIVGPGDNTSTDSTMPYVEYTGRTYNERIIAGAVRVRQGETRFVRVCNNLTDFVETVDGANQNFGQNTQPLTVGGINIFKDVNILASHLHGFYGNPGTDNVACDPMPTDGFPCYRGDNIFADMAPGQCTWYQYDFSSLSSPGVMWLHPHHHGSSSLQTHTATVPFILEANPDGGFDPMDSESCLPLKQKFWLADHSNEILLHLQTVMMAVFTTEDQNVAGESGPIDDGYITNAVGSLPGDPYCCTGPEPEPETTDGTTTWNNTGDIGPDAGISVSEEPFYTSGVNALFTLVNGAYQPVISMDAGKVYRMMFVQASTMKWNHISFNQSGCVMGLYSRDQAYLNSIPRLTDNIVISAANRVEVLIQCDAGTYAMSSGEGDFATEEPGCQSSHCELLHQPILATLNVAAVASAQPTPVDPFGSCRPQLPPYLADLSDASLNATYVNEIQPATGNTGLLNFTNPAVPGVNSSACAINGMAYQDFNALQEVIGELHELHLNNINVHPYHHHTQPFQIVALPDGVDSGANNGSWRIGDWADTLELPNIGYEAIVRWIPGPIEVTGTGYAVLHCHILPHEDEGCMLKTQILSKVYQPESLPGGASSQGGKAGITLAALLVFVCLIVVPVVMYKRKKKARQAEQEALVSNEVAQQGV